MFESIDAAPSGAPTTLRARVRFPLVVAAAVGLVLVLGIMIVPLLAPSPYSDLTSRITKGMNEFEVERIAGAAYYSAETVWGTESGAPRGSISATLDILADDHAGVYVDPLLYVVVSPKLVKGKEGEPENRVSMYRVKGTNLPLIVVSDESFAHRAEQWCIFVTGFRHPAPKPNTSWARDQVTGLEYLQQNAEVTGMAGFHEGSGPVRDPATGASVTLKCHLL